ncbi:potassium/sodium hyperpolarization-activated cyclic nucleotide-gated channel 1 [Tritrichomonas foetus]|uniref:Potassium/sodium hyperpolarization-activated cyclic nucleotide-gated channel 1 n=1 Tax=Tritrichomonas foetus TaxID=1144522 RepID=A0A1J4KHJ9_9EUKA|nr:potassium/sodium hyperpolarization-activated cyclic nucleotide-gated channel 1 [Tritrichomonas foetus]|eukprot:OHT10432.1 potassium/sodium hyperpolarization-activated cyclic nucleotide-gated channel 1 [Tritrichomonas foetus]
MIDSEGRSPQKDRLPQYWDLLTEADKNGYHTLKMAFNAGSIKRNRGHRIETFDGILDAIRRYAEQGNENDWKRFLVCGVCWMDQAIAINTRQLRLLISKCKSSINGSLQKLGFSTNTSHSESWNILFSRIPLLKDNFTEIRQWTIRYRIQPNMVLQMDPNKIQLHPQLLMMQHQLNNSKNIINNNGGNNLILNITNPVSNNNNIINNVNINGANGISANDILNNLPNLNITNKNDKDSLQQILTTTQYQLMPLQKHQLPPLQARPTQQSSPSQPNQQFQQTQPPNKQQQMQTETRLQTQTHAQSQAEAQIESQAQAQVEVQHDAQKKIDQVPIQYSLQPKPTSMPPFNQILDANSSQPKEAGAKQTQPQADSEKLMMLPPMQRCPLKFRAKILEMNQNVEGR